MGKREIEMKMTKVHYLSRLIRLRLMYNSFNILVSAYLHYSIGEAAGRSIAVDNNPVVSTCDDFLHCPLTNDTRSRQWWERKTKERV